ncbi:MAG: glycoside hydrolase [Elusimicrobia bacterium HGW-Elusimicrobia-1]|jgi:alpha-amylase/alpha-mannosidase (GH57 family)|nr:MAG: glycoside hydrolase [Elusimicrobia bacterium HGW-Elusimicrobia-1]
MTKKVCLHGHFYQPPRENPWLEDIELQDSAYPYHDWNERITAECYAPNAASRIIGGDRLIINIVNNYSKISFNFGPTLAAWLEKFKPVIYKSILEADEKSMERFSGHGSAIAQVYNHIIMPLASLRDKRTQVLWGMKDFIKRFRREPEGMWLTETAVDTETLEVLADYGIKFTILAPHQAAAVKKIGAKGSWRDVTGSKVDPAQPYLCRLPSGKEIYLFFYDGPVSQEIAFRGLLANGDNFAKRLIETVPDDDSGDRLIHAATDGETYGHHHKFGDMSLAYCLWALEEKFKGKLTIYGEYLEQNPPTHEVKIVENSSWSCAHGVERWRSDCGCNTGRAGWNQSWRAPLRGAMDWLSETLAKIYEEEAAGFFKNPWDARNAYIDVILDRSERNVSAFFAAQAARDMTAEEKIRALKLLEMQRAAMLMYTSCGWFFDDISGIETVQIMQYAARAMQLAKEIKGIPLEDAYVKNLERAISNAPELGNGARVWERLVKPSVTDLLRVSAHYAISSLFEKYSRDVRIYCYTASSLDYELAEMGKQKLAVGKVSMRHEITGEESTVSFAVLHLGDHNLNGGVRSFGGDDEYNVMRSETRAAFERGDAPEVIRLMNRHFGEQNYSLMHLFKDEQRKIMRGIFNATLGESEALFRQIYEHHYPVIQTIRQMNMPLPRVFATSMEFILNRDLAKGLENGDPDPERLGKIVGEIRKWSLDIDAKALEFAAETKVDALAAKFAASPKDVTVLEKLSSVVNVLDDLPISPNYWQAQNIYFETDKKVRPGMKRLAESGDENARKWLELFDLLSSRLRIGKNNN